MKKSIYLAALAATSAFSGQVLADVEDRDGVYDMQCDSATMILNVSSGTGTVNESADSILLNVEGESTSLDIPTSCEGGTATPTPTAELAQKITEYCNANLVIPEGWGVTCESLGTSISSWAAGLQDNISKAEIDQYYIEINPATNWISRWLGLHPSTVELTRVDGEVKTNTPYTRNSGKFDFSTGFRSPIIGGLVGYACIGGIADNVDGQVVELEDASYFGYAEEDNTAAIVCTKDLGEERLALSLSLHLEKLYSGPNLSGN